MEWVYHVPEYFSAVDDNPIDQGLSDNPQ